MHKLKSIILFAINVLNDETVSDSSMQPTTIHSSMQSTKSNHLSRDLFQLINTQTDNWYVLLIDGFESISALHQKKANINWVSIITFSAEFYQLSQGW